MDSYNGYYVNEYFQVCYNANVGKKYNNAAEYIIALEYIKNKLELLDKDDNYQHYYLVDGLLQATKEIAILAASKDSNLKYTEVHELLHNINMSLVFLCNDDYIERYTLDSIEALIFKMENAA